MLDHPIRINKRKHKKKRRGGKKKSETITIK